MSRNSIKNNLFLPTAISVSQDSQSLTDTIGRITDDIVEELVVAERRVGQVRRKRIRKLAHCSILLEVGVQSHILLSAATFLILAPETSRINIRAQNQSPEMRRCHAKTPRPHERIVEYLPWRSVCHIRRHQAQLRIHRRRADIPPLLQVICIDKLPTTPTKPACKINLLQLPPPRGRLSCSRRSRHLLIRDIILKDKKVFIGVLHPDRALKPHVRETLDNGPFLLLAVLSGEFFHGESEWYLLESVPAILRPPADVGVDFFIVESLAPELIDISGENAACYESACSFFIW